jgi:hypothetical protein
VSLTEDIDYLVLHEYDDGHECRRWFSLPFAIDLGMEPSGTYGKCEKCGEVKRVYGSQSVHYVPSVGHMTELSDAIEPPYWTCQR